MEVEIFEGQRYGRNKETQIDHTYINGGEYRRKFDLISDNIDLNRKLYKLAKEMLDNDIPQEKVAVITDIPLDEIRKMR